MIQFTFILSIALTAGIPALQPKGSAAGGLQGTWAVTSINGQSADAPEITVTFTGDKYHQSTGGKVTERGTFKLDASRKPITIDLAIVEGEDAGKSQMGIAEVSGDTLRMSLDMPGAGRRPADFTVKDGVVVIVAKKTKS